MSIHFIHISNDEQIEKLKGANMNILIISKHQQCYPRFRFLLDLVLMDCGSKDFLKDFGEKLNSLADHS